MDAMAGKRWRGLPWTRPSAAAAWGHDFEGGWVSFFHTITSRYALIYPDRGKVMRLSMKAS
jgi:hypothetical protein